VQASLESLPWRLGTILSRDAFLRRRGAHASEEAHLVREGASSLGEVPNSWRRLIHLERRTLEERRAQG
jgi:hypothetical protein